MRATLEIVKVAGPAAVQDAGRPGRVHEGIPQGGALSPERLARANLAVRNAPTSAGIEACGEISVVAREDEVTVADDEGVVARLAPGERFDVRALATSRVRYLAVRGAIDVPLVLGGRGTLLMASIGGFEGRPLRKGDRLPVGKEIAVTHAMRDTIRVLRGPDLDDKAWRVLLDARWAVSPQSDRMGTRLSGPAIPREFRGATVSMPMVAGSIEVPPNGEPVVFGPDHLTIVGYPVVAVVIRADLGAFNAIPFGGHVQFVAVTLEEARAVSRSG